MKSIIQEGSTIAKALEQAWQQAGMPQEFTVRVLQQPEHNFLGMSKKSAKIAILFKEEEAPATAQPRKKQPVAAQQQEKRQVENNKQRQPRELASRQQEQASRRQEQLPGQQESENRQEREDRVFWTESMVSCMNDWLTQALQAMDVRGAMFTTESKNYLLKVSFNKPLSTDADKEKDIFRNFSLLMLQALKNKLKRPLRGFKILVTRA